MTLFISRASQMDREKAKEVYRWFNEQLLFSIRDNPKYGIGTRLSNEDLNKYINISFSTTFRIYDISDYYNSLLNKNREYLLNVLKAADSDIVEFTYKNGEMTTFHHRNPSLPFDFNTEESEGTKILFKIMLTVMDVVRNNKVLPGERYFQEVRTATFRKEEYSYIHTGIIDEEGEMRTTTHYYSYMEQTIDKYQNIL